MRDLPILADGYAPEFLGVTPLHSQEIELMAWFGVDRIPVHKCFTRAWIEMVCSKRGVRTTGPSVRYLSPRQSNLVSDVHTWSQHWAIDEVTVAGQALLDIEHWTGEALRLTIQFAIDRSRGRFAVELPNGDRIAELDIEAYRSGRLPDWHMQATYTFDVPPNSGHAVRLRPLTGESAIVYQGAILEPKDWAKPTRERFGSE